MRKIETEEYKNIVLNVLLSIDEICREHDLRYMIFFGTLLGAVRHGGFIPWDDDIDVIMPREDYEKLGRIIDEQADGLRFICPENTPDTIFPFGKVCDARTSLRESNFVEVKGYGAYVDVFPVDHMPDDPQEKRKLNRKYFNLIRVLMHSSRIAYCKSGSALTDLLRFSAFHAGRLVNRKKLVRRLNSAFKALNNMKTDTVSVPWDESNFSARPEDFDECVPILFEGHPVMGPRDPDFFLRQLYGDYRELPPKEEQVSNHLFECFYLD